MKRIFNLILCVLCVISYTSCNNDEGIEYTQVSPIKIISRDVNFPASASQGSIVVEAPSAFTVDTSDKGWCTTTISGSTVQINVEENPGLDSRSSMLTIRCGTDTTSIAILQSGIIFDLSAGSQIMVSDEAKTYSYDIKCNTELTLTPSDDWITVSVEEGKMNITLTENNTGHVRKGNIAYTAGTYKDQIEVMQCDFEKDIAGEYMLIYTDAKTGSLKYLDATLSKTGNDYSIELTGLGFSIPVTYNQANGDLIIKAGQHIGDYASYKVHTMLWDTTAGYVTWSTAASMSAAFEYAEEEGLGYTIAPFKDNGSWAKYHPDAICLEAFSSTSLSENTDVGSLLDLIYPYLQRAHGEEATYRMSKTPVKTNVELLLK